jgi:ADP-heptose:LPS heptosyltransferase
LRSAYPDAEIDFLTRSEYGEVVTMFEGVDNVFELQIPGKDGTLFGLSDSVKRMCVKRYDLVIDLHGNLRSWWIKFQLNANKIVTYPKNFRARRRAVRKNIHTIGFHTVDLYLSALNKAGIEPVDRVPKLTIPVGITSVRDQLSEVISGDGGYAILAVGASHPTKHYPIPQWVRLAERIVEQLRAKIVIVEKERWDYLNLFDDLEKTGNLAMAIDIALPELAELISRARFAVSNDSGIMHLAAAVGTPTIGLFGPTHPSLGFAPLGEKCRALTVDESCSPCSRHGAKECSREERFCFTNIDEEMILRNVKEILGDHG